MMSTKRLWSLVRLESHDVCSERLAAQQTWNEFTLGWGFAIVSVCIEEERVDVSLSFHSAMVVATSGEGGPCPSLCVSVSYGDCELARGRTCVGYKLVCAVLDLGAPVAVGEELEGACGGGGRVLTSYPRRRRGRGRFVSQYHQG